MNSDSSLSTNERQSSSRSTGTRPDAALLWGNAKIMGGLLVMASILYLLTSSSDLQRLLEQFADPRRLNRSVDEMRPPQLIFVVCGYLYFALSIAFALEFLSWFYERYDALSKLGRERAYPSRWAVLGFLVPFANLVLPLSIAKEIWTKSAHDGDARATVGTSNLLLTWIAWIMSGVVFALSWNLLTLSRHGEIAFGAVVLLSLAIELVAVRSTRLAMVEIDRRQRVYWQAVAANGEDPPGRPALLPRWFTPRHGVRVFLFAILFQEAVIGLAILKGVGSSAALHFLVGQTSFLVGALLVLHLVPRTVRRPIGGVPTRWGLGEILGLSVGYGVALLWLPLNTWLEHLFDYGEDTVYDKLQTEISLYGFLFTVVIVAPLIEEFAFRGVMLQAFRSRFGPVLSVVLSALFFAAIHPYLLQKGVTFISGCLLGALRIVSGSLWPAIAMHAMSNLVTVMAPRMLDHTPNYYSVLGLAVIGSSFAALQARMRTHGFSRDTDS
ncbi:MAG: DUF4328 domain-containing protein [Thermoanaerobaculia bacterium]|nr:DUF4328 domain-containing protein [Thermoanaerobaculia bacterium]